jgi:ankyrin repeat protein
MSVDNKHQTALLWTSSTGHIAIVDLLLGMYADPMIVGDYGTTCIGVASRNGHLKVVQRLFGHAADWSAQDNYSVQPSRTRPLHFQPWSFSFFPQGLDWLYVTYYFTYNSVLSSHLKTIDNIPCVSYDTKTLLS